MHGIEIHRDRIVCVVLASGRGVRMGGPKALLRWGDSLTLAEAHTEQRRPQCGRVIVVTRQDLATRLSSRATLEHRFLGDESADFCGCHGQATRAKRQELASLPVPARRVRREGIGALATLDLVVSQEPDDHGPAGSIAAAVHSGVLAHAEAVLLTPVDVPPVRDETVAALLEALTPGIVASRPRYGSRRGHPVAIRWACLRDAYMHADRPPLRDVLRSLGRQCADVVVDDPAICADLDTPEAFEAWTGYPPRFA